MADKDNNTEEQPKKKSKLLIIIIVAVILLAGGGAAAYFLLFAEQESSVEVSDTSNPAAQGEGSQSRPEGEAIYVAMPRPFPFNAPGLTRERIVQIDVQLMVRGEESEELAKRHIPMIEGTLVQVFSSSNADDLVTDVGKLELRKRALAQVREKMKELENNPVVEEVLFTGFVIQ